MGGSSKKQTVGYKYFLGMHLVLTHGPVDRLQRIKVDDRTAWTGNSTGGRITINAPQLFGGDAREGGISGAVDFETGAPTQGRNDYLQSKLGASIPAFRGVAALVLRQCYLGNNPYLKKWAARLQRIHLTQDGATQWYDAVSEIAGSDYTWQQPVDDFSDGIGAFSVISGSNSGFSIVETSYGNAMRVGPGPVSENIIRKEIEQVGQLTKLSLKFRVVAHGVNDDSGMINLRTASGGINFTFNTGREPGFDSLGIQRPNIAFNSISGGAGNGIGSSPVDIDTWYRLNITYDNETFLFNCKITNLETNALFGEIDLYEMNRDSVGFVGFTSDNGFNHAGTSEFTDIQLEVNSPAGDMNPAHIIRECLTNQDWGMGYQAADMDDDSFTAAADALYAENMGISILWDKQIPIEDFVSEIVRHINAAIYVDRSSGKFVLKLIRDDYDEGSLITLNESNIEKVESYTKSAFGELVNSITVNYWDSKTGKTASVTAEDPALIQLQGSVIGTTLQYPGFTNHTIGARVAMRNLQALSAPLLSCTIFANRDAKVLNIGDVFKFEWPDYHDSFIIMRVSGMAIGDGRNNTIRLTCMQDVFSLPQTAVVAESGIVWEDPTGDAIAATYRAVIEAPYFELVQRLGQTTADEQIAANPDICYMLASAGAPAGAINARLVVDSGAGYSEENTHPLDFCPFGILSADVDYDDTTFTLTSFANYAFVSLGTHAQIGNELVKVTAVTSTSITVGRGVLDTVPTSHLAGLAVLFWDAYADSDNVEYVKNEVIGVKILPTTGNGTLAITEAPEDSLTFAARAYKPYPPGNLKIGAVSYPAHILGTDGLALTWAHRDRLQQTAGDIVDTTAASIGPEAGTTYTLRVYGESNTLGRTVSAIAGTSYTYDAATEATDFALPADAVEDPYWANVKLLVKFNGTNGGVLFPDSSTLNYTPTAYGNVQTSTAQYKFAGSSARFDGNGDIIRYPVSADWSPGTGDYTAEGWIRLDDNTSLRAICGPYYGTGGTYGWLMYVDATGYLKLVLRNSSSGFVIVASAASTLVANTWYHVAWSKNGNVHRLFVNGVKVAEVTDSILIFVHASAKLIFGRWDDDVTTTRDFLGYMDCWRITKGTGRYTADFTAPSLELDRYLSSGYRLNGRVRFELESSRGGTISLQKHDYTVLREGYGFNYGYYYGGT